jgi:hypothetical protein
MSSNTATPISAKKVAPAEASAGGIKVFLLDKHKPLE